MLTAAAPSTAVPVLAAPSRGVPVLIAAAPSTADPVLTAAASSTADLVMVIDGVAPSVSASVTENTDGTVPSEPDDDPDAVDLAEHSEELMERNN